MVSGIVPTAGGVIFAGDMKGNFFVLSATDGRELYRSQTGGAMAGGVANCHGGNGEGAIGPALKGLAQRMDLATTSQWIENPSAKMPKLYPAPLNAQAVKTVAAYVPGLK